MKYLSLLIFYGAFFFSTQTMMSQHTEIGLASYYGDHLNGRKTASGDIFDNEKFTAAHRTLPFNTRVKVTNLENNASVIVIINDRGPFSKKRIIDVSKAAAKALHFIHKGTLKVKLEVLE